MSLMGIVPVTFSLNGLGKILVLLFVGKQALPRIVQRDPAVGFFIPTRRHKRDMEQAMSFATKEFGARPIEEQATWTADAHRERHQPETHAAARTLIRHGPKQDAHGTQNIQP